MSIDRLLLARRIVNFACVALILSVISQALVNRDFRGLPFLFFAIALTVAFVLVRLERRKP